MNRDRLVSLVALGEVVALEHARHGVTPCDLDQARGVHPAEPPRVEIDASLLRVENLEDLRLVGLRICRDLFTCQRRPRGVAAGGVADHPGEVTGRGRIEPRLDTQRLAARQLLHELRFDEHLARSTHQLGHLAGDFRVHFLIFGLGR